MGSSFYDDHHHGPLSAGADDGEHAHHHPPSDAHHHGRLGRFTYGAFCAMVGVLLLLYALGSVKTLFGVADLALVLTVVAGFPLFRHALSDLLRGHLSSHLTIAIAAIAAIAVGEYFAAAEVMFIMLVGEGLEHYTVDRAKGAIAGFVRSRPRLARVRRDGTELEVDPSSVIAGESVIVRAGEMIPVDGQVISGSSSVDQSTITGEPLPAAKEPGDPVYSGTINEHGVLEIRAEAVGDDTTLARIVHLIDEAQRRRAPIVRTADRLSRYFLPAVVLAGGLIYLFTGEMLRTVAALIVACPCALVLATPAAVAAAIARLAREGVLVKGGETVEALAHVDAVAFDKTGTLTLGRPALVSIVTIAGSSEDEALRWAASAERSSEHLLGRALVDAARERGLELAEPTAVEIKPGLGVEARLGEERVTVGSLTLLLSALADRAASDQLDRMREAAAALAKRGETAVVVARDEHPLALLGLRDPLRDDAREAVRALRDLGVDPIRMLTGDEETTARAIAHQAGIDDVHARLLPEEKVGEIEAMRAAGRRVLMAGDGVNDAPALATADVGLAMGHGAADISAEAAQVVFLQDRVSSIPHLLSYSRKTIGRIRSSILVFAFGVNFGAVGLAAFGLLGPALAAIVHQGSSLAVILNSMRLLVEGTAVAESQRRRWRDRFEQLGDRLRHRLRHRLEELGTRAWRRRRSIARGGLVLLALLWTASGLTTVEADETGLVLRFGKLQNEQLAPGLHWRWPWPLERVVTERPARARALELGFRTSPRGARQVEAPPVYEWNLRHTEGPFRQILDESLMLTGDENLVEVYAVVHYTVADPARWLFAVREPEALLRVTAERTLRATIGSSTLDSILTDGRLSIEERWKKALVAAMTSYGGGAHVLAVHLEDAHPPLDVVDAFRDVASAQEERTTRVNEAEAYHLEQLPLARGKATAEVLGAEAAAAARVERSRGDSAAFVERANAWRSAPDLTAFRLYVEAAEDVLTGRRKIITDGRTAGRRRFLFYDGNRDGGAAAAAAKAAGLALIETPPPRSPTP